MQNPVITLSRAFQQGPIGTFKPINESVQGMSYIEELNVKLNHIELIPEWIGGLPSLGVLDLSGNKTLKKLHKSLLSLPLTNLDVHGCSSLSEPPYYVCEGGLENIRQYYTYLGDTGHTITLATLIIIGRKMAGKSSLIQTLQAKKVVRNNPGADGITKLKDETTKVFNLLKIILASSDPTQSALTVNAVDFGGDEIYHHAYQLTFRKDCIPMVVVNIIHFLKESQMLGLREATRCVVFDWISHLYLACPKLERPILVITHKDEAGQRFVDLKRELMATIRDLHRELLQERSLDKEIEHLQSTGQNGFFKESEIFEVQHDLEYSAVFTILENVIYQRVSNSAVTVPASWKEIMDRIRAIKRPHLNISDLRSGTYGSPKQTDVILDFMRRSGEILWYKDDSRLKDIIFHNIHLVKDTIKALFDHASQLWQVNSLADGSPMPTDIAFHLLKKFKLIYGPTTVNHTNDCYLIPYVMKKHEFTPYRADINLEGELAFAGLSIPVSAYQQMTVSFLKLIQQSECVVQAYGNGASARLNGVIRAASGEEEQHYLGAELIHEPEHQRVIARVKGDVSHVKRCWDLFLAVIKDLSVTVKSAWPAACIRYEFTCPHCLLLEDLNPEKRSTSDSVEKAIDGSLAADYREDCRCRDNTDVPSPLRYPCGVLQESDMLSLVQYIRSKHPDEEHEITRIMEESDDELNNRYPDPQTAIHPRPTAEVYQMSRTRGRALVINNRYGDITEGGLGRRGSDKDYMMMINMLESFGFIISHLSQDGNWTSQKIIEAVHKETELVYQGTTSVHESLGMFVLVMMSHGGTGTIKGCDDKHVNLVDIYKLLSSQYFPAMRGKPKLVVLQACSGARRVVKAPSTPAVGDPPVPAGAQNPHNLQHNQAGNFTVPQQATQSTVETNTDDSYQTIDDLLVMKPSFNEHVSYRASDGSGSFFIRALVAAFYRYAGDKDLRTLSDSIQQVERKKFGGRGIEQVPVTISTFTNGRKLYLSPGVNMRTTDHPESFTSRQLPPPELQRISLNWRDDDVITKANDQTVKRIVRFEVVKNGPNN